MTKLFLSLFILFGIASSQYNDEVVSKDGEVYKVKIVKIKGNYIEFEVKNSKGKPFIVQTYFDSLKSISSFRNGLKINIWEYKKPPKVFVEKKIETKIEEPIEIIDTTLIVQLEADSINVGDLKTPTEVLDRFHRIDHKPLILKELDIFYPMSVFDKNYRDSLQVKVWISGKGELQIIEVAKFTNDEMIQPVMESVKNWYFSPAVVEGVEVGVWGELNFILQSSKPLSFYEMKIIEEAKPAEDNKINEIENDSINIGDLSKPLDLQNSVIDKKPTTLKQLSPKYPQLFYDRKINSNAKIKVWISKEGIAEKIEVLESSHPLMNNAVRNAVLNWKFNPAQFKKKSVGVWAEIFFELRFE